jgi:hypothetical protein
MKLLYLSCHSVLEYDEIKLFTELGIDVFSPGAYVEPKNPGDATMRPGIPELIYDPDDVAAFHALGKPGIDNKELLTKEFIDRFDAVMIMHIPAWITKNWHVMKHKPVIWRTIGQSIAPQEQLLTPYRQQGLRVVRYSPKERGIPNYLGEDALIRFYKNPSDYGPWNGNTKRVTTFCQGMKKRNEACNFGLFEYTTRPFDRALFGPGNEGTAPWAYGKVPFEQLQQELKNTRVYFYTGTHPASYTLNFMEAWMTGCPIVAIGPQWGNSKAFPGHDLYEVPNLIENEIDGFVSDDPRQLTEYCRRLLDRDDEAKAMSQAARNSAIKTFGKEKIADEWKEFLKTL